MDLTEQLRKHYRHRIDPSRENFDVLDWASAASQIKRFEVLAREVPPAGKSLLDIGCGLGDLWAWLHRNDIPVDYTGVDILCEMVAEARRRHPAGRFECRDVLGGPPPEAPRYDVVFASGTFNLNTGDNEPFIVASAERMMALAREAAVFNLLHVRARAEAGRYYYAHPDRIREALAGLPCRVRILDDYLPNDFTVVCERNDADESTPETSKGSNAHANEDA